jgi:oligopeptide transport system substrate-binding protein
LVDMWQKAFPGLKITTATIDRGQQIHSGKILQLTNAGWGADYPDPQDFLTLLWSKNAAYNQSFVDLPAADALLDKADKGSDLNTRLPLYQQAEQLFTDNGAWIVLTQPKSVTVVRNTASGFHYTASLVVSLPTYQTMFMKAA